MESARSRPDTGHHARNVQAVRGADVRSSHLEALEGAGEIDEPVNSVVVHVAPFAAGYASDGAGRQFGVASIPHLVSAAIAEPPTGRRVPPEAVVVRPAA